MVLEHEATYLKLTYVHDESMWKSYIYSTKTLPYPGDVYDCSFLCKNVKKEDGCDLFLFDEVGFLHF